MSYAGMASVGLQRLAARLTGGSNLTFVTFRASVRPALTYLFAATIVGCVFLRIDLPEPFKTISTTVITFWFARREEDKRRNDA